MENNEKWQHFQHIADIGIRGFGESAEQAFANAATAMTAVITEPVLVENRVCVDVQCEAVDLEYLFVKWINALVYEMATRHMLFNQFDISISKNKLIAKVCGEKVDRDKHQPAVEIKGATLTELHVAQRQDGNWMAQCIVDV
jgi:tRNA nucleotidyltransferase (CCA-adding enzyme)